MKYILLFFLFPFLIFSQSSIKFSLNDNPIDDGSKCPFYVVVEDSSFNLLSDNLIDLLIKQDSFKIQGEINQTHFISNNLKLMKNVKDHLIVDYLTSVSDQEFYVEVACVKEPRYKKVVINTLRDSCVHYVSAIIKSSSCSSRPAYYLNGEPIYDENPKENRKIIKSIKRLQKKYYRP